MAELPTGTVTLLFSDIEGSTVLLSRLGEDYAKALAGQREVLRRAWAERSGTEMGTEGDSFYVAFSTAHNAVSAALQAQRDLVDYPWPGGERVRVRMGIHTGEPIRHDGAYVGMDVHRAARIAAAAHGGQVVITDATCHLLGGRPPEAARLSDLGWHRLKDLQAPEHLYQVDAVGLDDSFPPLKSLGTTTNLPAQSTPLVGREDELRSIETLLRTPGVRLVTLTGPGGVGKTRLATEVAAASAQSFPDGVFFVALAAVSGPEAMWTAIIDALSTAGETGTRDRFLERLAHRRLLVVLDNLEQLSGADSVVSELIDAAPGIAVIATSRRPLHLRGEHEHFVPPLDLPRDVADAEASGAVQLFCQHAAMVRSGFTLTADIAEDVVAICARLDGLPLAIELAAARSKLLSPSALLARLETTLELRAVGVDRPSRQRTLRETIAWSYDLLDPHQQALFRRLGVFAGAGDLAAIAVVADVKDDPLDKVADLVDVSLVSITDGPDGEPRVAMLHTVADFAVDRLSAADELEATRRRHAEHYLALSETLTPQLHTAGQVAVRGRLEVEHDNLRHALDWALQPGEPKHPGPDQAMIGMRLCVSMWWYWASHGHLIEGRRWVHRALEVSDEADSPARAGALHALSVLTQGVRDELAESRERLEASLGMFRRLGDLSGMSDVANTLAQTLEGLEEPDRAHDLYQQSIRWAREADDELRLGSALVEFAFLEFDRGDPAAAIALIDEARDIARRWGNERDVVFRSRCLAGVLLAVGDVQQARALLIETVPEALRIREPTLSALVVGTLADLFVELGDFERGARLGAMYVHLGVAVGWPIEDIEGSGRGGGARQRMSREAWERAVRDGRGMSAEEALKDAQRALVAAVNSGDS